MTPVNKDKIAKLAQMWQLLPPKHEFWQCFAMASWPAGPNKRAGWNFFQKINKRAGPNKSEQDGNTSNYK